MGKVEGTIKCVLGGDCVEQRDVSKRVNGSQSARGRVLLSSQSPLIVQVQHYEH